MRLTEYTRKRRFDQTPEPKGRVRQSRGPLHFVVQRHDASHPHYDFRLELDGVLVSWAVPEGPSLDPKVKRLAIQVEDHPLEYGKFEGDIPSGNYGAGTVRIWDHGTYTASGADDPAGARRLLKEGLAQGHLDLVLAGEKLQGGFHLKDPKEVKRESPASGDSDAPPLPGPTPGALPSSFKLTHPGKVFWPSEGYTKGDLARYYRTVAEFLLPSLKDRPESMHRFPNGIGEPGFFQKHLQRPPHWIRTVRLQAETVDREIAFLVCDHLDALLYMVNLGCIDLNPWHSRVASLDHPDYLLLDLDAKTAEFPAVLKVAAEARRLLEEFRLSSVPKTSGKTGIHICLPLGARYTYDQARALAEGLMHDLNGRLPDLTSVEFLPERRQGRVYLDFLQNHKGKTMASPYSVRPVPGAPVSTPLDWSEVKPGLDPAAFTLVTAPVRFRQVGDLWAPVLGPAIDLPAALEQLQAAGHGKAPGRSKGG